MGEALTRHSLRPPFLSRAMLSQSSDESRRENAYPRPPLDAPPMTPNAV